MAGGLAKQGMVPVVALYSTFLQRSYDQILQDIAMLRLHCVLAVDRAGLVGEDGETHHGVYDVAFLRQAQGMQILCPASTAELASMLRWSVANCNGPVAVRYPRGGDGLFDRDLWDENVPVVIHRNGCDGAIVTYGTLVNEAQKAADILESRGIHISVIRLTRIHPMPVEALEVALAGHEHILIAEEASGGIAENIAWNLSRRLSDAKIRICDLGHDYVSHGDIHSLYKHYGLDAHSLADRFMEVRKVEK
jgi:1-deoxy-D-xylulose-5-phosphate synthase